MAYRAVMGSVVREQGVSVNGAGAFWTVEIEPS